MKDKHKAHDIVHTFFGGKAENCPNCKGEMDDKATASEAMKIAAENYKPQVNPMIAYGQRLMQYDEQGRERQPDLRSVVDVMKFSEKDGAPPKQIKLLPIGNYDMNGYGKVEITKAMLQEMKKHFDAGIRAGGKAAGLPIDIEHGSTPHKDAAAGWIKELALKEDGIYGDVDWTKLGEQLLTDKIYKFYSPEFWFNYTDPEHKEIKLKNVMTGGGLVNKPMIKHDLNPLVASEDGAQNKDLTRTEKQNTMVLELTENLQNDGSKQNMKLSEIIKKAKTDRSADEQKFVNEHKDELTFAEAKTEGFAEDKAAQTPANTATQVTLSEGQTVVDKAKLDGFMALAEKGEKAFEELRKVNIEKEVKAAVFSETGVKLPTDQIGKWTDKLMKMSEEDKKETLEMLKSLPEKQIFGETGATHEGSSDAAAEALKTQIQKYQEDHKGATYREAASAVAQSNPAQFKEYSNNLPVAGVER